ncbi:hypothetical protein HDU98_002681, partial [Podochytrium sp. JEL0797]
MLPTYDTTLDEIINPHASLIAELTTLRSEVLKQMDAMLFRLQLTAGGSASPAVTPPTVDMPVEVSAIGVRYIPSTVASQDKHVKSTRKANRASTHSILKSHLDLGIHWNDGDYRNESSQPVPIFSEYMKRGSTSQQLDAVASKKDRAQMPAKASSSSMSLVHQMFKSSSKKSEGVGGLDSRSSISGRKGLRTSLTAIKGQIRGAPVTA